MRGIATVCVYLVTLVLAGGGMISCKGFDSAANTDGAVDLVDAGSGSGGKASGTGGTGADGGTSNGTGGAVAGTGGSGTGGTAPGTGGADSGTGGADSGTGGAGSGTGGAGSGGTGGGSPGCGAAQHLCAGTCVDSKSINSCGQQCEPCNPPTGATATCDGTSCDFTCGASMKKCAAARICIASSGCCADADCPAQPGGQTGTCDSGTHMCNYACGANQKACTVGGTTTCLPLTGCCKDSDCMGTCQTCSATSHTCVAAQNRDDPNARCAGTCDAQGACKSKLGQTCTTTTGGCASGSTCSPDGYCCDQACTGPCMACDLAGKLGACSPVASGAPHGSRQCLGTGTTCGGSCGNRTDGACVYPTGNCGSGPTCDSSGTRAQSTCSGGSCITPSATSCPNGCNPTNTSCLTCGSGQTGCSGVCKTLATDPQNCGLCGQQCATPTLSTVETAAGNFGAATCAGSQCGWTCGSSFMKCPGTTPVCTRKIYDFEDGTTQGHIKRSDLVLAHLTVVNRTTQHHTGSRSLALPLEASGGQINIDLPICAGANMRLPVSQRSISVWYFLDGPVDTAQSNWLAIGLWGCKNGGCTIANTQAALPLAIGVWTQIVAPVPAQFAIDWPDGSDYSFSGYLYPTGSGTTLYVDDIVLQ